MVNICFVLTLLNPAQIQFPLPASLILVLPQTDPFMALVPDEYSNIALAFANTLITTRAAMIPPIAAGNLLERDRYCNVPLRVPETRLLLSESDKVLSMCFLGILPGTNSSGCRYPCSLGFMSLQCLPLCEVVQGQQVLFGPTFVPLLGTMPLIDAWLCNIHLECA